MRENYPFETIFVTKYLSEFFCIYCQKKTLRWFSLLSLNSFVYIQDRFFAHNLEGKTLWMHLSGSKQKLWCPKQQNREFSNEQSLSNNDDASLLQWHEMINLKIQILRTKDHEDKMGLGQFFEFQKLDFKVQMSKGGNIWKRRPHLKTTMIILDLRFQKQWMDFFFFSFFFLPEPDQFIKWGYTP